MVHAASYKAPEFVTAEEGKPSAVAIVVVMGNEGTD